MASSIRRWFRLAALLAGAALSVLPGVAGAGVNPPQPAKAKGEQCVEDTELMRRNHMDFLKHHRDKTMREGIRTTKHSLKKCVECHASEKTGSVAAAKDDFCVACHAYASVKLDCWDCHATKPRKSVTGAGTARAASASPMLADPTRASQPVSQGAHP